MRTLTANDVTRSGAFIPGRNFVPGASGIENFDPKHLMDLKDFGILFDESEENTKRTAEIMNDDQFNRGAFAFDSVQPTVLTGSVTVPIQKLQYWLEGTTQVLTATWEADNFMGYRTLGAWESEQVVQQQMEYTGDATLYMDGTNNRFASYQNAFNYRNIIRFQQGLLVSELESRRTAAMQLDNAGTKRASAAYNLEVIRNQVEFYGFNTTNVYGFLNAPELPSYVQVPTGTAGPRTWASKTAMEIVEDLLTAYATLIGNGSGWIKMRTTEFVLALPTDCIAYLTQISEFGWTPEEWILKQYPKTRIVDAVQLQLATSNSNVFYLFAEKINDPWSTDGGNVWIAGGPTKFMMLGVQQLDNGFKERYTNGTMGALCPRPWAVVRYFGI